jgi:hypothetical protein
MYKEDDTIICKKYGYDCDNGCIYFVPDKDGIGKIENVLKDNEIKRDSITLTLHDLIKNRKVIRDFEEKYRTEINILQSCIKQDSCIHNEHSFTIE